MSRNGHSFTNLFGPVSDTLRGFPTSILLDGEVIVINDKGQPDFEALQARLRPRNGKLTGHLCYMIFNCLYVNGHSLLNRTLEERQAVLWELQHALQTDAVKLTEGFPSQKSARLMKACAHMGLEGVVMKRKGSLYRPGFRSPNWIKVPIHHREEFVAAGYLASSPNHLSSLILGQRNRDGKLIYSGLVGTGLSKTRLVILQNSKPLSGRPARSHLSQTYGITSANSARTSASLGATHISCRSGIPTTTEGRATSRGVEGAQARKETRIDSAVPDERTGAVPT